MNFFAVNNEKLFTNSQKFSIIDACWGPYYTCAFKYAGTYIYTNKHLTFHVTIDLFTSTLADANKCFTTEIIVLFIMKKFILLQDLFLS